ncbi:flagellar motor switch protein FliG [Parasphingorhabdus sp.]|uniref:flagellar motor switch protein FliG n=1 Tax=Parasphingorhabdus sp. TaxID=2709688 RepID=UPI0032637F6A
MPEATEQTEDVQVSLSEDGTKAAAILLMLISEEQASDILTRLEPEEVKQLGQTMYSVADVGVADINQVFDRFIQCAKGRTTVGYQAGEQIQGMLTRALGEKRAENMLTQIAPPKVDTESLEALKWMNPSEIVSMLEEEHPQVKALVMSFLEAEVAATTLKLLPEDQQDDIVYRVATMRPVSKEAIATLEQLLLNYSSSTGSSLPKSMGGVSDAAAIMNNLGKQESKRILKLLTKRAKQTALSIEDEMFVFADLINLDVKNLGTLMRSIDNEVMIPALKGAEPELKEKIFSSMSSRAVQSIEDEMEDRGPIPGSEVIAAQKAVIAEAKRLADEGTIMIGGADDDFV